MLPLDLGQDHRPRQPQTGCFIAQRLVLPDPSLYLPGRAGQARHVVSGHAQPVHGHFVIDAGAQRLRRYLHIAVQHDSIDGIERMVAFRALTRADGKRVGTTADLRTLGDDVKGRALALRRKESGRLMPWVAQMPDFLRAGRPERANNGCRGVRWRRWAAVRPTRAAVGPLSVLAAIPPAPRHRWARAR